MAVINSKKAVRMLFLLCADILILSGALFAAYWLRFEGLIPEKYFELFTQTLVLFVLAKILVFVVMGLYNSLWRYAGVDELFKVFLATLMGTLATIGLMIFLPEFPKLYQSELSVPRSVYAIAFLIDLILVGGLRFSYRALRRVNRQDLMSIRKKRRSLIIGAGDAGAMVIKELKDNPNSDYEPVAVIDDDPYKLRKRLYGVKVVGGRDKITSAVINKRVDEIIIAIPSLSSIDKKEIIELCESTGIVIKTIPKVHDIISGKISISDIRPVDIEDLLGRTPVKLDLASIDKLINGKVVLITGGGGSIGSEIARQVAKNEPQALYILDIYENNAYDIINELHMKHPDLRVEGIIASVRDQKRIDEVFTTICPQVVFHAAAHKHVPLMEANPAEAIKNNVFGTYNVVKASHDHNVDRFVMISTDKAVNPTNVMGASKRLCEMIVEAFSTSSETVFAVTRFGNVLGSNGSVIPLFKRQIAAGGPVTVTHPDIIRYFMTIPEAVQLVIQSCAISKGGELFVLDMGEQIKIDKLARDLIRLSGLEPDKDIEIVYTGLRPGEKLYEELLMSEEGLIDTEFDKLHVANRTSVTRKQMEDVLVELHNVLDNNECVKERLQVIVPTYKPLTETES